ncbi:MAG: DUF3160 domain-containing protein [Polyangiaceae bacterium]|nr:DUF3160 domain-containing protein [Polyangiaceae bacterium]
MVRMTGFSIVGVLLGTIGLWACTSGGTLSGTPSGTEPGGQDGSIATGGAEGKGEGTAADDDSAQPGESEPAGARQGLPYGPASPVTGTDTIPDSLRRSLETAAGLDGEGLEGMYPPPAPKTLGYDPLQAKGMDLLAGSAEALSDPELARLGQDGFVVSRTHEYPSFAYGYKSIYADDLPVYVSADSILEPVHRSFDLLLKECERSVLIAQLGHLLAGMRANLPSAGLDAEIAQDADLYVALAGSLLEGTALAPVAGAHATEIAQLFELATAAQGHQQVELFGVQRDEDFSQFEPRGHYTDDATLGRYFKAMMWLGRVDLRLVETQGDGTQVFHRRQFDAAVALNALMTAAEKGSWKNIDQTLGAFVGEPDSMSVDGLDGLLSALGVSSAAEAMALTDAQIVEELERGGWGAQRIASRILIKGPDTEVEATLPLDRSYALFGQRYTVDSHVFVNVTHDRVPDRLMPDPLDVAFAALGNDAALPVLSDQLAANDSYAQGLAKSRALVDAHEADYWEGSIYTEWLGALRALSPSIGASEAFLPAVTSTTAWQRRILSTQLASWAELRRDTILYTKQSYTIGYRCEFPDAYVDPYPELYARLGRLAQRVAEVVGSLPMASSAAGAWAANFGAAMEKLELMANNQQSGTPHSQELLNFINDAVTWQETRNCDGTTLFSDFSGWYLKLYLDQADSLEFDPVVADVHTQPTDEAGNDVGRILHVGTGTPRLMVVTVDTCDGPRAYAGLASSYGEHITEDWERMNDQEWASFISRGFPDAAWMSEVFGE